MRVLLVLVVLSVIMLPLAGVAEVLEIDEQEASIDTDVTLTLYLDSPLAAAAAFSFNITYDADILEFVAADFEGTVLEKFDSRTVSVSEPGVLSLNAKTAANAIQSGASGSVVKLIFTVISDDDCELIIENLKGDVADWSVRSGMFSIFEVPAT